MKHVYDTVESGNPLRAVVGATVQVNYAGGGPALIYDDLAGTILATNPVTTDARGAYSFYAPDDLYDVIYQGTQLTTLAVPNLEIASTLGITATIGASEVRAGDYGAVGNGVTDDTAAIQAALTAAAATGRAVTLLAQTYKITTLTIPSGVILRGAGSSATTLTSASTGTILGTTQSARSGVQQVTLTKTGTAGGVGLLLAAGQYGRYRDLVITGPLGVGIRITTVDDPAMGSSIYNAIDGVLITGLAANGVGLQLTELSGSVNSKVVNDNRVMSLVIGPNANDGITAVQILNPNARAAVNENLFLGGDWSTTGTTTGTGLTVANGATRNLVLIGVTIESNQTAGVVIGTTGADTNEGLTVLNCEISGNGANTLADNFTDHSPAFRHLVRSQIGGVVASYRQTPTGAAGFDGIGLNGATPAANDVNFAAGGTLSAAGSYKAQLLATGFFTRGLFENDTAITVANTPYTVLGTDAVIWANATGGAITVTLPTPVGIEGRQYAVKKTDASGNAVTVGTAGGVNIDAAATKVLAAQYNAVRVMSDGAKWQILGDALMGAVVLLTAIATDIELHWTTSSVHGIATDHIAYVNDPTETVPGTPTKAPYLLISPALAANFGCIAGAYYHVGENLNGLFVYQWQPTLTPDLV